MRLARIKIEGESAVYHCISRIVGGQFLLADEEKEKFRQLIWLQSKFSGVEVITYCVMSNHFHLLIRVPGITELDKNAPLFQTSKGKTPQLSGKAMSA